MAGNEQDPEEQQEEKEADPPSLHPADDILMAELDVSKEDYIPAHLSRIGASKSMNAPKRVVRQLTSSKTVAKKKSHKSFGFRMLDIPELHNQALKSNPDLFHDYSEDNAEVLHARGISGGDINIPSLQECRRSLVNKEMDNYKKKQRKYRKMVQHSLLDLVAAFIIYLGHIIGIQCFLVVTNACMVTWYFCSRAGDFAVKLDFSFLAFSVVFPLTFLVQASFSRRDQALSRLADFKSCVQSTCLLTLLVDWPCGSELTGGRQTMPSQFNMNVAQDSKELLKLVYEYLSMPVVSHARNIVFSKQRLTTKRVHALQNDIIKRINDVIFDFHLHTEEMRKYGFPSGEASRLHQYHQYLQQRFEQLRQLKYYRTPQATRSFGRVYLYVLPWFCGPYFAWVFVSTNYIFTISLAGFTFIVLLGLLNAQQGLEDPFLPDYSSWAPGIDTVKLDYEIAVALQAIEQYFANTELRRLLEEAKLKA